MGAAKAIIDRLTDGLIRASPQSNSAAKHMLLGNVLSPPKHAKAIMRNRLVCQAHLHRDGHIYIERSADNASPIHLCPYRRGAAAVR